MYVVVPSADASDYLIRVDVKFFAVTYPIYMPAEGIYTGGHMLFKVVKKRYTVCVCVCVWRSYKKIESGLCPG